MVASLILFIAALSDHYFQTFGRVDCIQGPVFSLSSFLSYLDAIFLFLLNRVNYISLACKWTSSPQVSQ